jgi:hypothetical protein
MKETVMSERTLRQQANEEVFRRLVESEPVLVDIVPAGEALAGMTPQTILASGPTMPWRDYFGGQRNAIIGGALFEGLARDRGEAEDKLDRGAIAVRGCHEFGAVGSVAGIYTASMPVFVVRNTRYGNIGYCNFYEGTNPRRLNYGVYDDGVKQRLDYVHQVIAPVITAAVRRSGGIALKPIMQRALHMGDELHSRNTAASLLFARELFPHLIEVATGNKDGVLKTIDALTADNYFFLRLSMAAAKAVADAAHGVAGASVVSAMTLGCRAFAIRVSGLGDRWFSGPHPQVQAKLFDDHTEDEITWMGGESIIAETVGLGGFAQAGAPALQLYQGGSVEAMIERNLELYRITVGENPNYKMPYLGYRGTPTGIDIFKVIDTGVTPAMDVGIAGRDGGQIGAGIVRAAVDCFHRAAEAYRAQYGTE